MLRAQDGLLKNQLLAGSRFQLGLTISNDTIRTSVLVQELHRGP